MTDPRVDLLRLAGVIEIKTMPHKNNPEFIEIWRIDGSPGQQWRRLVYRRSPVVAPKFVTVDDFWGAYFHPEFKIVYDWVI